MHRSICFLFHSNFIFESTAAVRQLLEYLSSVSVPLPNVRSFKLDNLANMSIFNALKI